MNGQFLRFSHTPLIATTESYATRILFMFCVLSKRTMIIYWNDLYIFFLFFANSRSVIHSDGNAMTMLTAAAAVAVAAGESNGLIE